MVDGGGWRFAGVLCVLSAVTEIEWRLVEVAEKREWFTAVLRLKGGKMIDEGDEGLKVEA